MTSDVDNVILFEPKSKNITTLNRQVLLFCHKHPRMKFTAECIPLNNKDDKTTLSEELQVLVAKEIINQQISDTGVVFYCLNRTQQELVQLIQNHPERGKGSQKENEILRYTQNDSAVIAYPEKS